MTSELRVAVIGLGSMGTAVARVLAEMHNARLMAVCDIAPEATDQASKRWGVPGYLDFRRMLADGPPVEAVCICTPDQAHVEPSVFSAGLGKHVLIEKPLATTVADGETIIASARAAGVKLMVGHILRFDPRYVLARQAVTSGRIGEPIHAFARRNNQISVGRRIQGRTSVLFFLGIHDCDFLLWSLGKRPTSVYAVASRRLLADLHVDDSAFMSIEFEGGTVACIESSWALPPASLASLDARLEIVGTKGAVYVDIHGQGLTVVDGDRLDKPDTMYGPEVHGYSVGILRDEIASFVSCILDDRDPVITGDEALDAVRVIAAAQRSLASHSPDSVR